MLTLRHHPRTPAFIALLVLFNIITLITIYTHKTTSGPSLLWTSQDTYFLRSGDDDFGSGASKTVTVTVAAPHPTAALAPAQTPKAPGPHFCEACGPTDLLCNKYGLHNLARSRLYEGSNSRFHRIISNAKAGKPIKMAVLGGSVSKGHGLTRADQKWWRRFEAAWKELFPKSQTTVIDGAVPATGSDYFSMCFREHIPEDVDLVFIELSINDERLEGNAVAFEWLMRGLMELPNRPAVLSVHTIGLSFETITRGGDLHVPIAAYYDSPVISLRNMIAPQILKNKDLESRYFHIDSTGWIDLRHVSLVGHTMMFELLLAYTQRQICAVELETTRPNRFRSEEGDLENYNELGDVPRLRLFQQYDNVTVTGKINPTCQSTRTDKHPLVPIESKGWEFWVYKGNKEKPYLRATEPGSYAKFAIEVGVMGRVRITYLNSKTFGLGDVWCWLDDYKGDGTRVSGWWPMDGVNVARVAVITKDAKPGKHTLTCEILPETLDPGGGHEFRLVAIDAS